MSTCVLTVQNKDGKFGKPYNYICWAGARLLLKYSLLEAYEKVPNTRDFWPPGATSEYDITLVRCAIKGTSTKEHKALAFQKCREWFADHTYLPFDEWEVTYMESNYIDVPMSLNAHAVYAVLTMLRYPFEMGTLLKYTEDAAADNPKVSWDTLFVIAHLRNSHNSNHGMFNTANTGVLHPGKTLRDCFKESPLYQDLPENSLETIRELGGSLHSTTELMFKRLKGYQYTIHCQSVAQFLEKLYPEDVQEEQQAA